MASDKAAGIVKRLSKRLGERMCCNDAVEDAVIAGHVLTEAGLAELIEAGRDVHYFMESQPTNRNYLPHESYELRQRVEKLTAALAKLEGAVK